MTKRFFGLILAAAFLCAAFIRPIPAVGAAAFGDVEADRWSSEAISHVYGKKYMIGVGDGLFGPERTLTRAEVVTALWRREGEPAPAVPCPFSDVEDGAWYASAVGWAKEEGIVLGVSADAFDPDRPVTREQLAAIFFRFSSRAPVSVPERADLSSYSDVGDVRKWAVEPFEWAVESGIMIGTDGDTLSPGGHATREQLAEMIFRYDGSFSLRYAEPVVRSHYTEPEYPLVTDADFYVAADGSDEGDGSFDHPFATWGKAVEAVRGIEKTAEKGGVTVAFKAGEYGTFSVTLTAEDTGTADCPVTYCKYGDGDVVFNGGKIIRESDFEDLGPDDTMNFKEQFRDRIKKVFVGDAPRSPSGDLIMYSGGGISYLARFPNKYDDGTDQLLLAAETVSANDLHIKNSMMRRRIESYADISDLRIYGFLTYNWNKETLPVLSYDRETATMTVNGADSYFSQLSGSGTLRYVDVDGEGNRVWKDDVSFAFLNVPEELDQKGEYVIDKEGRYAYFFDPEGEYVTPGGPTTVRLYDANNVTFRGLTFIGMNDAAIRATRCSSLTIDQCNFKATSGNEFVVVDTSVEGVDFDLTLTRNDFDLAPLYAVRVHPYEHGNRRFDWPTTALIDNNRFSMIGVGGDGGTALAIRDFDELTISHNEFVDCQRYAVTYDGCINMTAEYNTFLRCMYNSDDGGIFYTGNDREQYNNVIRYNLFYPSLWYGVYVDDGGIGTEVFGNLFYGIGSAVCIHDGRDNYVHDNYLVNTGGQTGVSVTDGYVSERLAGGPDLSDRNNRWGDFYHSWLDLFEMINGNADFLALMHEARPELFTLSTDPADADEANFVLSPANTLTNNVTVTSDPEKKPVSVLDTVREYCTVEGNRAYGTDENPCFVNPTAGDYRIRDGADFPYFPYELIGRY